MKILDFLSMAEFQSEFNGSSRELLIALPMTFNVRKSYNVVISPHPFGFSHFENYTGGPPTMIEPYSGWKGLANRFDLIVACPLGHGRVHDRVNLAYEAQIDGLANMDKMLAKNRFLIKKMYAVGFSMGATEVLTLIGRYPGKIAAAFSFNGISDLSGCYEDIVSGNADKKLIERMVDKLIVEEAGGSPDEAGEEFLKRSPMNYIENISKTPLMIHWSSKDSIAVNQKMQQPKDLYDRIKQIDPDPMIFEHDHSSNHDFKGQPGIRFHEYCDYEKAMNWLLEF